MESGLLTGFVECDIKVPEAWHGDFKPELDPQEYFSEFSPFFSNSTIPFEAIGPHMQEHVEACQKADHVDSGKSEETFVFKPPKPKRLLVGGMRAERLMLATPLVQWYLKHGCEITKIRQICEFRLAQCFKPFIDEITDMRRAADSEPRLKIVANCCKLLSNASYGSILMDRTKHSDVMYVKGRGQATTKVKSPRFKQMTELSDEMYEISMEKKTIRYDLPVYIGVWVLNIAKLIMLRFVYDVIDRWIPRRCYQICFMDTDSIYLGLSGMELRDVIAPEHLAEYDRQTKGNCRPGELARGEIAFPRVCCAEHAAYDKRQPGLFNNEYKGRNYIGLNSKTYVCQSPTDDTKFSCKGLQKDKVRDEVYSRYERVLTTKQSSGARNMGFRQKEGSVWTYSQYRKGLSYYYGKRIVAADGSRTSPLQITLNPWT